MLGQLDETASTAATLISLTATASADGVSIALTSPELLHSPRAISRETDLIVLQLLGTVRLQR